MMQQKPVFEVMNASAEAPSLAAVGMAMGIGAVERDTGLSKDTLRVWERRYAFPKPSRDAFGERLYSREQVEKLRAIKRLMDCGFRPGKIMHHGVAELNALGQRSESGASKACALPELDNFLTLVRTHQVEELRRALGQEVARGGLGHFVTSLVRPLNVAIGELWMQGSLEIFEEHLYTESLQVVLRNAIANVPRTPVAPRVMLTTLPNEQHGLGLLMAEAMLVLEGVHCVSLGVETPVWDIVRAAVSQKVDIVALSFSQAYPPAQAVDGVTELRRHLADGVELWIGGASEALVRRLTGGMLAINDLRGIAPAVAKWRLQRAG
jgi:DNA-binding transcriptional MerR regulator/methylmalonyl-CoA mutase cobalamin-binding subunit